MCEWSPRYLLVLSGVLSSAEHDSCWLDCGWVVMTDAVFHTVYLRFAAQRSWQPWARTIGIRLLLLKTQAFWDWCSSSASPHRTSLGSFSFIQKSGVLNEWRLRVTNVAAFASPRPVDHLFIQQEGLFKTAIYADDGLKVWLYLQWFTRPPHLYSQLSYYIYKCASCKWGSSSLLASATAVSCI